MARWARIYDKKGLWQHIVVWLVSMVVCYVTKGNGVGLLAIPMMLSLSGKHQDFLLVFLTIFVGFPMSNHVLVPKGAIFNLSVKLLWISLAVILSSKVAGRRQSPLTTPFLGIIVYALYMLIPSLAGWNAPISLLKLFLFIVTFFAFYEIANVVILGPRATVILIRSAFLAFALYILLGSILIWPIPSISQMRLEYLQEAIRTGTLSQVTSLYCGMMYHSQALGPVVAVMGVMVLADYLFSIRKFNWLYTVLLLCAPILIYKTSSRTAMGTMAAGILFVGYLFLRTQVVGNVWRRNVISIAFLVGIGLIVSLTAVPQGRKAVAQFVSKNHASESLVEFHSEDLVSTRQGLVDIALYNFKKSPLIGNGFQVSDLYKGMRIRSFQQLLSAPIEKGVWVTAILEEGGCIGLSLFLLFFFSCLYKLVHRKAYIGAAVLFTYVVSNLGEFSMFSMSGVGGYAWAMCFMGVILDAQRLREEKIIYWAILPNEGETDEAAWARLYGGRKVTNKGSVHYGVGQ